MGKESEIILWKNNDICPNCGKKIEDVTKFRCCEFGNSYCNWKCAKEYVNKNYKEIDSTTMSKRRHQKLEDNPSEGLLNTMSEINKRINLLAEKVGIDFNPFLPNIEEISVKEITSRERRAPTILQRSARNKRNSRKTVERVRAISFKS
jgi:hypothetical protein